MTERGAAFLLPLPLRERAGVRGGQEGGRDRAYRMTGKRKNAGFPLETCGNDRRGDCGNDKGGRHSCSLSPCGRGRG